MRNRTLGYRGLCAMSSLLIVSVMLQGCSYFKARGNDALDFADVGFTFSMKPQLALYYDFVPIIPIGYGEVDGKYVGLGKGDLCGWSNHYERSYGAILWGQEDLTFRKSNAELAAMSAEEREKETDFQRTGLFGVGQGPFPGPNYLISCPHYIHIGWVGVVATPRYLQMLDFVLGWTTLDICSDDKARVSKTQEPPEVATTEPSAVPEAAPAQ